MSHIITITIRNERGETIFEHDCPHHDQADFPVEMDRLTLLAWSTRVIQNGTVVKDRQEPTLRKVDWSLL